MTVLFAIVLLAVLVMSVAVAMLLRRRGSARQRTLAGLLDAADGLEDRLRTARGEIEAVAGSEANPVRDALQQMLRQRLWLKEHAHHASLDQLTEVRASIDAARAAIDGQLAAVERARAPLA